TLTQFDSTAFDACYRSWLNYEIKKWGRYMFYMYGKKLSIDELADAICASASSLKNGTIKIIAEHVDESVFFSRVRSIKLLDYVLISYVLSNYFLHLAVFKRIPKSTIADILVS